MKLKYLFELISIVLLVTFPSIAFSQVKTEKVLLDLNRSRHGTGDMGGWSIDLQYNRAFSKRLDWYGVLGFSMYDLTYLDDNPNIGNENYSYEQRYVTAGIQIGGGIDYKPLATRNEICVQFGPIIRYQSSSLPVSASTYYPDLTQLPFVVERVQHGDEPLRTLTLGAKLRVGYSYTFKKGLLIGTNAYLQTDTNGDTIYGYGLTIGKRFTLK